MASRYWVLGSGNWDASDTTHWSASSGGAGGASVPSPTDDVFFDLHSNEPTDAAYTVTITASANCNNLDISFTGTTKVTWAGSSALNIYGNLNLSGGTAQITRTFTGALNFFATSTGKTVSFNGVTMASATTFNGVGGGWTLQDDFNNGTSNITLTAGTLDTNGKTVTCGTFTGNSTTTRTLTLGASTINVSTSFTFANPTNATLNANTSTIAITGNTTGAGVFGGGGLTYNVVTFTSTGAGQIGFTGANTFTTLTITGPASKLQNFTFDSNQTVTNFTIAGNSLINRILISSSVVGTPRTFTCTNAPTLSNVDFQDITAAGAGGTWTGTSIGDCLGNSNITVTTPVTRYGVVAGNWSSTATWSTSDGGAGGASVPLPQDTVYLTASSAAGTYTADMPRLCATLDCNTISAFTRTLSFGSLTTTIYGAVILSSGAMTISGTNATTLSARSSVGITSNSKTFSNALFIVAFGGTYTLQDNLSVTAGSINLINGTLDTNGKTVTCQSFNGFNSTATRVLTLGASTINCSVAWNCSVTTGLTFSGTSSTIAISGSTSATPFAGGGLTYNIVTCASTVTTSIAFTGANSYTTLTITGPASKTQVCTFSATQTVSGTLTINGNSTVNRLLVQSATVGTAITLSAGTIVTGNVDWMDITAGGSANWDLTLQGTNSSGDCGGNTSITFTTAVPTTYTMVNSDNWSTAARWSGGRVPLPQDDVTFGSLGTSKVLTADMPRLGKSVDMSGGTFTTAFTFTSSIANSVFGSYILLSGMTYTANSAVMTLGGRSSYSLTGNTVTINQPMTVNAPSGTYSLGSNTTWSVTSTLTITNGTLSTSASNYVISTGLLSIGTSGTLTLGTETDLLTGTGTVFTGTGTLNANTSTIKITDTSNTAITFTGGNKTFNNVWFSRGGSTGSNAITGNNTFNDFKDDGTGTHIDSFPALGVNVFTTFTVSGTAGHLISITSNSGGVRTVLIDTSGSNVRDYLSLQDTLVGGGATWTAGANSTFVSNNEGWSDQPATPSRYWVGGNGNWSSVSNWSTTSGGASGASVPTGDMNVFFDASSGGGYTSIDTGIFTRNLDFSNFTGTLVNSSASTIYGTFTFGSGMTNKYTGAMAFGQSLSSKNITNNGISFQGAIAVGSNTSSIYLTDVWTLQDSLQSASSLTVNSGTFNANNFNITILNFISSSSNTRTITMGSGTWTLTNTGAAAWTTTTSTNCTLNANTSTIKITGSTTTARTFAGGGLTFNNLWLSNATSGGQLTITGSNTFNDFKCDTPPQTLAFTAGTTQTVTTFTVSGTAGNLVTIDSAGGSTATHALVKSGGGTISCDYLSIQHSVATPSSTWYAGTHSTDNQAVATAGSGWVFTAPPGGSVNSGFLMFM